MTENRLMKDGIDARALQRIAQSLAQLFDNFAINEFIEEASHELESMELRERVNHVIKAIDNHLNEDFNMVSTQLIHLPKVWDWGDRDDSLSGFAGWPIIDYVAHAGIDQPKHALPLLAELTPLFSAEFAIRHFIEKYQKLSFEYFTRWLKHPSEHVRRLVSEGTRPRLPWGMRLKKFVVDPSPLIPLLNTLRLDESDYVKRSVANNVNDISKDHPERVIDLCKNWQRQDKGQSDWVIRHGTRTLVKSGHPDVFGLLGYDSDPEIKIKKFTLSNTAIHMGDDLWFSFTVESMEPQKFVLDYAIHFVKANGDLSAKVFKIKNMSMQTEAIRIEKKHSFKFITTRKYYPGKHAIALHVNGREVAKKRFTLME